MTVQRKRKDTGGKQKEPESLVSAEFSQRMDSGQKDTPGACCYLPSWYSGCMGQMNLQSNSCKQLE